MLMAIPSCHRAFPVAVAPGSSNAPVDANHQAVACAVGCQPDRALGAGVPSPRHGLGNDCAAAHCGVKVMSSNEME